MTNSKKLTLNKLPSLTPKSIVENNLRSEEPQVNSINEPASVV